MHGLFLVIGLFSCAAVGLVTVYLVTAGIPAIAEIGWKDFFLNTHWASTAQAPSFGIGAFLLTSVWGVFWAIVLGVPLGILCAVYLAKLAPPKVTRSIEPLVDILASIPSVVYGLLGMFVLVPAIRKTFNVPDGAGFLAAIIVLAVMILPSVIKVSLSALRAVPHSYEEASLALGATELETVFRVTVPAARSGIAAAITLGVGRAMGEAMAVMMVAGNGLDMPTPFASVRFLTTAVASEMSYSAGLQRQALFSIALVLFALIMLLNQILHYFVKRSKRS